MQNLIEIKQLPIIEEQLNILKGEIKEKADKALSLECNEESYKEIKKLRAELNKDFKELESRRKEVKSKILAPYEAFEGIYKDCVSNVYNSTDNELKSRINEVEDNLKGEKEVLARTYFDGYCTAQEIDFLKYENCPLNITMAISKKKIQETVREFVDKVAEEYKTIQSLDNSAEIFVEYKNSLNLANAIESVTSRKKEIEAVAYKEPETLNEPEEVSDEPLSAPITEEEVLTMSFKVTAPIGKLKELKAFMDEKGYEYE